MFQVIGSNLDWFDFARNEFREDLENWVRKAVVRTESLGWIQLEATYQHFNKLWVGAFKSGFEGWNRIELRSYLLGFRIDGE
jgi:hypothetical protein